MKCKRKVSEGHTEPWLDYHIRSLHNAYTVIKDVGLNVHQKLDELKHTWAGHISRFGAGDKEPHLLKALLAFLTTLDGIQLDMQPN